MKVQLKDIHKSYGDKEIIKGINLEINSGELISLLGPSGCGKSTTLFMLAGLEDITKGNLLFGEKDVTNIPADKRGIGLVFQNYALYPHFTVLKNVMYPILNQGKNKKEAKERALEVLESVELLDHIDKLPAELSGGQQQRVAIARAIAKNPEVLLLDEPISNLDAKLKEQTSKEIRNIQKKYNITTVFVTHDQQEALAVSDRIVILDAGKIQQVGTPKELYKNPQNLYVSKFIGTPSINVVELEIKDKKVKGLENLFTTEFNIEDGTYLAGLRPEYFYLDEKGYNIKVDVEKLLGRDIQLSLKDSVLDIEIILRNNHFESSDNVKIKIQTEDVLLFDKDTEKRVK